MNLLIKTLFECTFVPEQRAIAFCLLNKAHAIDVFGYLPPKVQEELIDSLHDTQVVQIVKAMRQSRSRLFNRSFLSSPFWQSSCQLYLTPAAMLQFKHYL
ncbi:hypothetical protein ABN584_10720 [Gloeocapsa sp. BRSZ]